jgi:hypothetical protein
MVECRAHIERVYVLQRTGGVFAAVQELLQTWREIVIEEFWQEKRHPASVV